MRHSKCRMNHKAYPATARYTIPKNSRRHLDEGEEDRREQKTRGEDGRREVAFSTKSQVLPFQGWRTNKAKRLIYIKNVGVKPAFSMETTQINN